MNPRALLVPPYLYVVFGGEESYEPVVEGREGGYAFVSLMLSALMVVDLPYSNFVILMGTEKLIPKNY